MKVIYLMEQVNKLGVYPIEVTDTISNTIEILDENYGEERNIETDLGGYVVIVENTVDIEMLKQSKLNGTVAEYTDVIECSEEVNWTSSLFLISNDFSIVAITTEELTKFLIG